MSSNLDFSSSFYSTFLYPGFILYQTLLFMGSRSFSLTWTLEQKWIALFSPVPATILPPLGVIIGYFWVICPHLNQSVEPRVQIDQLAWVTYPPLWWGGGGLWMTISPKSLQKSILGRQKSKQLQTTNLLRSPYLQPSKQFPISFSSCCVSFLDIEF